MSDQIPFHIQEEIMKKLPVKSLVQFRCVSKAWNSLIDSCEFIAAHSIRRHTQPQHLLVSYADPVGELKYVCYIDDDTFPKQMSVPTLPLFVKQLRYPRVLGSSHGLLCLYGSDPDYSTEMAVLWNPSIRKLIVLDVPGKPSVGFGVCPVTGDTKFVSITQSWDKLNIETSYRCEVMVYTLSSGKWRTLSNDLPTKPIQDAWSPIVTDKFIYWNARQTYSMIMSFDVTNENFEVIALPASIASYPPTPLTISKLGESLAILEYNGNNGNICCTVWMMEHGVQRSFTKLFNIMHNFIVGFRKNGIPIMQTKSKLVVYEPNSEHNNLLEIKSQYSFNVNCYMETLLLLGRSDCNSY